MFSIIPLKHRHHFSTFIMLYTCIPAVYKNEVCSGLTNITLPNSISSIKKNTFRDCTNLTNVTIPNSVIFIYNTAFQGCTSFTNITIPNSVTFIGENAFSKCSGLTSIVVDANNKTYDSRDNCNAIIETESNQLVVGCMTTTIPNSVTTIKDYAFYGCTGLTNVIIPKSISSIGTFAFLNCRSLTNVYSHRVAPPSTTGSRVFDGIPTDASLHVPGGCIDAYRQADNWKNFVNIYDDVAPTDLVTSIRLNKKELELEEWTAAPEKLIATVLPDNATNKTIKWTTSNAAVATVNEGLVQGREPGTAYIIASTTDGSNLSDTCVVTVKPEAILAQSVTINKEELKLTTGQNEQLTATVSPDDATNKLVEWSSDNTAVATVSKDGVVTAVAPGNATITAKTTDGTNLSAKCAVTVVAPEPEHVTGDVNGDNKVDVADINTIINVILENESADTYDGRADVNGDGKVDVADINSIIDIILGQ